MADHDIDDTAPAQPRLLMQAADQFATEEPQVVAMPAQRFACQPRAQQMPQERREAVHHRPARREVARLNHPAGRPPFEVRAKGRKRGRPGGDGEMGGGRAGCYDGMRLDACCPLPCCGFCTHAVDQPPQPLPSLSRLRLRQGPAVPGTPDHRDRRAAAPRVEAGVLALSSAASGYDQLSLRRFEFIPFWGLAVMLLYHMRRVECRTCGVVVEELPWASGKHQLTKAYMLFLAHWARKLSWQETAVSFRTSWDKVCHAVEYVVAWGLANRTLGPIRAIGVDEIAYAKGHKYLTLVYQIEAGCTRLLWIGKDRTVESFEKFFDRIGKPLSDGIAFVCSDMWKPYLRVIRERCPNAVNILDRFHIVAKMNDALNDVRAAEARRLSKTATSPSSRRPAGASSSARPISPQPNAFGSASCCATISRPSARTCSRKTSSSSGTTTLPPGPPSSSTTGASRPCARASSR